jgi:CBS domain-containing protein
MTRDESTVGAAMHRGVITCSPDSSGVTVARIMAAHHIHSVVVSGGSSSCIITDTDLAAALHDGVLSTTTATEIARVSLVVATSDALQGAAERMHEHGTTHAVVVEPSSGELIGILSVLDIANAFATRP